MEISTPALCRGGRGQDTMSDGNDRARANIRLALALGVVALGFFVLGLYLATGNGN